MPIRRIFLSGGLVTSKDPSMLADGELTRADNCEYRPNDPAIWKVKGRAAFNATPESSPIDGGRYLEFEGATDLFATMVGGDYRKAPAAGSGSFENLDTTTSGGSTLDSVHYNNQHFLMNGADRNRVISSDGLSTLHGMLYNTTAPTVTDTGVLAGFSLASGNTIEYWVEERVKDGDTIVKRSADTGTTTVTLTGDGTNQKPVITRPDTVNSDATHWAVYATATNGDFPVGAEVAEAEISSTTIEDPRTTANPTLPTGDTYETVAVTLDGIATIVARNGAPPIASTGDVLEDSLVMNDSEDMSRIRYTFPDKPHAFPAVNFIRFETKEADEVRLVRRVGRSIVVGMRSSMWRVDTLPRPEDASFQIERVTEQIHGAHGVVGPMAACLFAFGDGIKLAYISRYGLLATDAYTWGTLSDDLDWPETFSVGGLSTATLINNPAKYRLEMDALLKSGERAAYYFYYHSSQIKPGLKLKVTGPITRKALCSFTANIGEQDIVFTGQADGVLYQEGAGASDASGEGPISMVVRTGDIYAGGIGGQATMRRAWFSHKDAYGQAAAIRRISRNEGEDDREEYENIDLSRREATGAYGDAQAEAFQFGIDNEDARGQVAFNFIAADFDEPDEAKAR